jgi:hypothetical protein
VSMIETSLIVAICVFPREAPTLDFVPTRAGNATVR